MVLLLFRFVFSQKIRDTNGLTNLKSYFIKTVFLWYDVKVLRRYWEQPMEKLFFIMLDEIIRYVDDGYLPFFWDQQYNMFAKLTDAQLTDMLRKLRSIRLRLLHAISTKDWDAVNRIFCTCILTILIITCHHYLFISHIFKKQGPKRIELFMKNLNETKSNVNQNYSKNLQTHY